MANTLKFGRGTWATKTGSSMAYNDQSGNYKPLPFNVERDSIATRVNKQGLIEVVGKDKLRIDYTDSAKGVALLEPSRTNLQTYSSDLSSVYVPTNITQTSNYGASPDGSLTSTRVVLANLTDSRSVETLTGTLTNGVVYTFSCYYKGVKGESTYMYFLSSTGGVSVSKEIIFTGDWQRESITFTAGSASNYTYVVDVRQGTPTATDFEVWGAQVEEGSYATSYIPTSGSTVTRQADVVNGSGNSEVFNDSEGVLFADISGFSNYDANSIISISDGSASDRLLLYYGTTENTINIFDGTSVGTFTSNDIKLFNKVSVVYDSTSTRMWVNGFEVLSISSVNFSGLNVLNLQNETNALSFYGKTKEVGYYDATLTDSELEYLTSYRSLNELVTELNLNTL